MLGGDPGQVSASRAVMMASATSATATMPTQRMRCKANTTSTAIGARIITPNASHRITPRRARNQYPPASIKHAPTAPTATIARLARSAKPIMTAAAANISTKAARASQRTLMILTPVTSDDSGA